jgi:hypothetical protein
MAYSRAAKFPKSNPALAAERPLQVQKGFFSSKPELKARLF